VFFCANMSVNSSVSTKATSGGSVRIKKDDEDEDFPVSSKDERSPNKTRKSVDSSSSANTSRDSCTPQRRLHIWTDRQVVLLLRAAVALKVDPGNVTWGKMTGCYTEMARILREAPNAAEDWGENIDSALTVSKIRSKFESVILLLASNKYRVRSKDPKVRDELQELFGKLHALQANHVVISEQEAKKRWKDELDKLRQLWLATKKTDLPKARSQSALKTIRDLKKLRPQLDVNGNCVFPETVLFDGKVSNEIAAQAQAAIALAKNSEALTPDDDQADDDDEDDEEDDDVCNGTVDQQDDAVQPSASSPPPSKQSDDAPTSVLDSPKPLAIGTASHLIGQDETLHAEERPKKTKNSNDQIAECFGPQKKRQHRDTPPSEETCKQLTILLKHFLEQQQSSGFCSDCNENGERCSCRFSRTELLSSSCLTDSCPACHHPICHHP